MQASSIQAPSQHTLDQIDDVLRSGRVNFGPIFAFDAERRQLVFVHIVQGQVDDYRIEHCANRELYGDRVRMYLDAALTGDADLAAAVAAAMARQRSH